MNIAQMLQHKGSEVFTIAAEKSVLECAQLMNRKHIGALVVVSKKGDIAGIVTERDILNTLPDKSDSIGSLLVKDIMTHKERLITGTPNDPVPKVMEVMTRNRVRHLPITDDNNDLVGLVSIGDVVKNRLDAVVVENESMRNYISGY